MGEIKINNLLNLPLINSMEVQPHFLLESMNSFDLTALNDLDNFDFNLK